MVAPALLEPPVPVVLSLPEVPAELPFEVPLPDTPPEQATGTVARIADALKSHRNAPADPGAGRRHSGSRPPLASRVGGQSSTLALARKCS